MYFKYPSTPHLPWSPGVQSNDLLLDTVACLVGREVVVTEKLDGENCSMYADHIHARSITSAAHPSRDYVKVLHARIQRDIPTGWRLVGENLYARHSIAYLALEGYFYLFSVWNEHNVFLSWDDTKEWAELLELPTPREFYRGIWNQQRIQSLQVDTTNCEGYVVRTVDGSPYSEFAQNVAKWVRPDHQQTDQQWLHRAIVPNGLAGSLCR